MTESNVDIDPHSLSVWQYGGWGVSSDGDSVKATWARDEDCLCGSSTVASKQSLCREQYNFKALL